MIEWLANRPRLGIATLFLWRATWIMALLGTLGLLGAALALGVFGVGGHDVADRVSIGALLAFMALMMFAIGSLARLSAAQLKAVLGARGGLCARRLRRCPS
ncbi:hypothetical protein [Brevundimonas sp.]|uniref:hypothetical protein n=1 Tax=Brevundimonas sp. TaxID=1871086 RepID=UPI00391DEBB1